MKSNVKFEDKVKELKDAIVTHYVQVDKGLTEVEEGTETVVAWLGDEILSKKESRELAKETAKEYHLNFVFSISNVLDELKCNKLGLYNFVNELFTNYGCRDVNDLKYIDRNELRKIDEDSNLKKVPLEKLIEYLDSL